MVAWGSEVLVCSHHPRFSPRQQQHRISRLSFCRWAVLLTASQPSQMTPLVRRLTMIWFGDSRDTLTVLHVPCKMKYSVCCL